MSWTHSFPLTTFGFTAKAKTFDQYQCEAVRRIPGDRIVLESSPSDLADEHAVPRGAGAQATGPGR